MSAPHSDVHHTNIIEALCDPPEEAQLQIAVWSLSSVGHMMAQKDLIDYLGLHFSLDPRYLMAVQNLIWEVEGGASDDRLDRYNPTHTKIGNAIITVCLPRDGMNGIPVVLIAQYVGQDPTADRYPSFGEESLEKLRRKQLHLRPPLRRSHSWESQLASLQGLGSYRYYPQMLTCLLESQRKTRYGFANVLLICFLPCLQLQLVRIRSSCGTTRILFEDHRQSSTQAGTDSHTKKTEEQLYSHRTSLRREISNLESQWSAVIRYMKMRLSMDPSEELLFKDFEEEIGQVIAESNRLESQIRDYLQLRAGTLGLEESRRSIDLSNRQIEEAKRVKIFTILAFVYIPLNLATSVFGMNLQQLNGSGQSLVDFVLTALLALIITGGTWYVIEIVNVYRKWQEDRNQQRPGKEPSSSHSVAERIGMIILALVRYWQHEHQPVYYFYPSDPGFAAVNLIMKDIQRAGRLQ
ncbi:MAG: hypothetical protein Q9172_006952 [Xanthocarpia lactea]